MIIGGYISEDFYFCIPKRDIYWLRNNLGNISGKFVFEKSGNKFQKMNLFTSVDYSKNMIDSTIEVDHKRGNCYLKFSMGDFKNWFVEPTKSVQENGPNWRYVDSNVYIKTIESKKYEDFMSMIEGFLITDPK